MLLRASESTVEMRKDAQNAVFNARRPVPVPLRGSLAGQRALTENAGTHKAALLTPRLYEKRQKHRSLQCFCRFYSVKNAFEYYFFVK